MLGAYLTLYPKARVITLLPLGLFSSLIEIPAFIFLAFWFAWQFLAVLAEAGSLGDEQAEPLFARSDRYFDEVWPTLEPDEPAAIDGVPEVLNPTDPPFRSIFGGDL